MTKLEELHELAQQAKTRAHRERLAAQTKEETLLKKAEAAKYRNFKREIIKLLAKTAVSFPFEGKWFEFTGREILYEILKHREGFGRCASYGLMDHFGKNKDQDELRRYFINHINMPTIARPQLNAFLEDLEQIGFINVDRTNTTRHYGVGSDLLDYDIHTEQYNLSPWAKRYFKLRD